MKITPLIKCILIINLFLLNLINSEARNFIKELTLQSDTNKYYLTKNSVQYLNEKFLFFKVSNNEEVCEITIFPEHLESSKSITLLSSSDYDLLDSLVLINNEYYRGKIKFNNLKTIKFARFVFEESELSGRLSTQEIKLFPYFKTLVSGPPEEQELFVNEDKSIDLLTENEGNLQYEENDWVTTSHMDYKLLLEPTGLKLMIHPRQAGEEIVRLKFKTIKPYLNDYNQLTYDLPAVVLRLSIKPSRINFLNFDQTEFFFDPSFSKNNEVQIDFTRALSIKRTYRIENQQEPGGKLVAELFTISQVGNSNKLFCWLKTYSLHRKIEGYLFIKEGDQTKFITNLDIIERPRISKVSILKEGGQDWQTNLNVSPGENIEVRIEGSGLAKANVLFDIGSKYTQDTARKTDHVMFFNLKIPIEVNKRKIAILMNKEFIGYDLQVNEFQRPRDFDFILIDYNGNNKTPLNTDKFLKPVLYKETIEDLTISFDHKKIDQSNKIYGKQIFNIEIKIFNERKDLVEFQKIENVIVCPGDNSPRAAFYDTKDCQKTSLGLNQYLIHKTFDQEGWSSIELTFKHAENRYSEPGYSRKILLIKEKYVLLDMQVSFPTGLIVKRFGETGFGRFSGVSTAFLAQFSFYDREKIGKLKPYKVGAGLIALDIFNSNQALRDLGIVVLGSLSPLRSNRFSFPIYGGGGYFIQSNKWFLVFGPGIQFNF